MIHFVVALQAEAAPIIRYYGLREAGDPIASLRIFRSKRCALIIAGVGKTRAAAGTALLHGASRASRAEPWLNIGIAGHRDRPLGTMVRAHTIEDHATGERFFPPRLQGPEIEASAIRTVDRPETAFATADVYEMEASGFFDTAMRLSTIELVQCLKIVSDNRATGTESLTRGVVSGLVESHLSTIDLLATHIEELAERIDAAPTGPADELDELDDFIAGRRFTTTQSRRLKGLLRRWKAFGGLPPAEKWKSCRTAQALLDGLEAELRARALGYEGYE